MAGENPTEHSRDYQALRGHILAGRFDAALALARDLPTPELSAELLELSFATENLGCYGFCVAMIEAEPGARGHGLASDVLASGALCRLPGAYQLAWYHASRAVELAPDDIGYREFLLFFYGNPEALLTRAEAEVIARELLARDPGNQAARTLLGP